MKENKLQIKKEKSQTETIFKNYNRMQKIFKLKQDQDGDAFFPTKKNGNLFTIYKHLGNNVTDTYKNSKITEHPPF